MNVKETREEKKNESFTRVCIHRDMFNTEAYDQLSNVHTHTYTFATMY